MRVQKRVQISKISKDIYLSKKESLTDYMENIECKMGLQFSINIIFLIF